MAKEFSIEEKIYNKILLLQVNDEFMADVLALRKKVKEIPPEVIKINDEEEIATFYDETDGYENDVRKLMSKYGLSNLFYKHLGYYIANDEIIASHESHDFPFTGYPIPRMMEDVKPIIYTDENGYEDIFFPDKFENANQKVAIEIFPETTLNDFIDNWERIAKQRDELYGIKNKKDERFMKSKNIVRDLEIYNLKKQGKTSNEITKIINADERFKNEKISYQDVSKIIKRLKEKSEKVAPYKET